ncbi:MAG: hypothetical protein QN130_12310 [Armatimonadota bacterium]|nr:hypothetical protein [Armatimonadota bacterium]
MTKAKESGTRQEARKVPRGLAKFLQDDGRPWDPELLDSILGHFFAARTSLPRTARMLDIPLGTLRRWIDEEPELARGLQAVVELVHDRAHQLYLDRVFDATQKNPAWAIFWLKKNIPTYFDSRERDRPTIQIVVRDATFQVGSRAKELPPTPPALPAPAERSDGDGAG